MYVVLPLFLSFANGLYHFSQSALRLFAGYFFFFAHLRRLLVFFRFLLRFISRLFLLLLIAFFLLPLV